ncbi:30S ribosomal protein S17 [symbiont of Argiope bruennichi]|uniref:30S ribosomal protein S17 n=1 Tax=symbiont of Argiope bruennichi TaxID=2810479 RepID=UPI003DA40AF5
MKKIFKGKVVAKKMEKTVTVEIVHQMSHPLYKKTIKKTKKFLVHDPKNESKLLDIVKIVECRPISKRKRFRLLSIVEASNGSTL